MTALLKLLVFLWDALAAPAYGPAAARLGHDSFAVREEAAAALRAAGPLPWPVLARCADSHPDPEVRTRCRRLLAPADALAADLAALWWLVGPGPAPVAVAVDEARRERLSYLCRRMHLGTTPDSPPFFWWALGGRAAPAVRLLAGDDEDPAEALAELRRLLRDAGG